MGEYNSNSELSSDNELSKAILEHYKVEKSGLHKVDIDSLSQQGLRMFGTANDHFTGIFDNKDWWALSKEKAMATLSADEPARLEKMLEALQPLQSILEEATNVPVEDQHGADYELAAALNNQLTIVKGHIHTALEAKNLNHE